MAKATSCAKEVTKPKKQVKLSEKKTLNIRLEFYRGSFSGGVSQMDDMPKSESICLKINLNSNIVDDNIEKICEKRMKDTLSFIENYVKANINQNGSTIVNIEGIGRDAGGRSSELFEKYINDPDFLSSIPLCEINKDWLGNDLKTPKIVNGDIQNQQERRNKTNVIKCLREQGKIRSDVYNDISGMDFSKPVTILTLSELAKFLKENGFVPDFMYQHEYPGQIGNWYTFQNENEEIPSKNQLGLAEAIDRKLMEYQIKDLCEKHPELADEKIIISYAKKTHDTWSDLIGKLKDGTNVSNSHSTEGGAIQSLVSNKVKNGLKDFKSQK